MKDIQIDKLKGAENYRTWCFAIKNALIIKVYEKCIEITISSENVVQCSEPDADKRNKCKACLTLYVDTNLYLHINECKSALEIWQKFEKLYEDSGLSRKTALLRNLISTKLEDCENMQEYLDKIKDTANRLKSIKFDMKDDWLVAVIMAGLTDAYKPFIMIIEASDSDIKADKLIKKLLDSQTSDCLGGALFSKSKKKKKFNKNKMNAKKGNGMGCGICEKSITRPNSVLRIQRTRKKRRRKQKKLPCMRSV